MTQSWRCGAAAGSDIARVLTCAVAARVARAHAQSDVSGALNLLKFALHNDVTAEETDDEGGDDGGDGDDEGKGPRGGARSPARKRAAAASPARRKSGDQEDKGGAAPMEASPEEEDPYSFRQSTPQRASPARARRAASPSASKKRAAEEDPAAVQAAEALMEVGAAEAPKKKATPARKAKPGAPAPEKCARQALALIGADFGCALGCSRSRRSSPPSLVARTRPLSHRHAVAGHRRRRRRES